MKICPQRTHPQVIQYVDEIVSASEQIWKNLALHDLLTIRVNGCHHLHLHLSDAFIQSNLQCIQAIHFCQYVCSLEIEPTTFCVADAMLYHWATGTAIRMRVRTANKNITIIYK